MSYWKGNAYECPTCGQPPGHRCRTAKGQLTFIHLPRIKLAEAGLRGEEYSPPDEWRWRP